jgi:Fe2+ or Zn2+ uptake regulation protein
LVAERRVAGAGVLEPTVALRRAGVRCTAARLAILKALGASPRGLSLASLPPALGRLGELTLRRNLDTLSQHGLLHTVYGPAGEAVLLLSRWGQAAGHPHAHCGRCGAVFCLSMPLGTAHVTLPTGFVVETHQILVSGQCAACALLSDQPAVALEAGAEKAG